MLKPESGVLIGNVGTALEIDAAAAILAPGYLAANWKWAMPGWKHRIPDATDIAKTIRELLAHLNSSTEDWVMSGGLAVERRGDAVRLYADRRLTPAPSGGPQ